MKTITIGRMKSEKDWTLSHFESTDIGIAGVGCEDEKRNIKVAGETRIPAGTYKLALRDSPKFSHEYYRDQDGILIPASQRTTPELQARFHEKHEMIWITSVPGFEFILLHWGNTDDDTDGCYLVGSAFGVVKGQKGIINSRKKYSEIYPKIWKAIRSGDVQITFIDND